MKITRGHNTLYAALILTLFLVLWAPLKPAHASDTGEKQFSCDLHCQACSRSLSDGTVTLDIEPKPVKAMVDLLFRVTITGIKPDSLPYIDLGMPGMDMGRNRVEMKPAGVQSYEGRGIIVRCPSGGRTWKAAVTVPGSGMVEFLFHVVY